MNKVEPTPEILVCHLRLDGTLTRFLDTGDPSAPVLLLLHDGAWGGSSSVTWQLCIPFLSQHYRVIAPDFLGFGGSDKMTYFDRSSYEPRIAQLAALVTALDITGGVHVIGSSFGGSVALRILENAAFHALSVTSIGGSGGKWKTDVMADELGHWDGTRRDLARIVRFLSTEDANFETQLDLRLRWALEPGHYRALASASMKIPVELRTQVTDTWPEQLQNLSTPTLLISGTRDELFNPQWIHRISERLTNCRVVHIDSLHSPNLDQPEIVASVILDFVDQVTVRS